MSSGKQILLLGHAGQNNEKFSEDLLITKGSQITLLVNYYCSNFCYQGQTTEPAHKGKLIKNNNN